MYRRVQIRGFRCFKDLSMNRLARINLVAGYNGVGKTALLEALWLHRGYHNPQVAIAIENFRGIDRFNLQQFLWNLFRNFDDDTTILIATEDTHDYSRSLEIQLTEPDKYLFQIESNESMSSSGPIDSSAPIRQVSFKSTDSLGQEMTAVARIEDDPAGKRVVTFKPGQRFQVDKHRNGIFLSSMKRSSRQELAGRFSSLSIEKQEDVLVDALGIVEGRIADVSVQYTGGEPMIYADIGSERLFPIALMGDGIYRLLSYILAITEVKDGEVLIDEVDNGFHFSVMRDIWRSLAKQTMDSSVQLFATTHSQECIRAAAEAFQNTEVERDFLFHRLEREDGETRVVSYDIDELSAAFEVGLEMR